MSSMFTIWRIVKGMEWRLMISYHYYYSQFMHHRNPPAPRNLIDALAYKNAAADIKVWRERMGIL